MALSIDALRHFLCNRVLVTEILRNLIDLFCFLFKGQCDFLLGFITKDDKLPCHFSGKKLIDQPGGKIVSDPVSILGKILHQIARDPCFELCQHQNSLSGILFGFDFGFPAGTGAESLFVKSF